MKRYILFFLLVFSGGLSALEINPHSQYQIVLPDGNKFRRVAPHLERSAEMLRSAFKNALGIETPVVKESRKSSGVKSIFLGDTQAVRQLGIDVEKYDEFACAIREKSGNIYIAGLDKPRFEKIDEGGRYDRFLLGTVKGAVHFAEEYLGTRFLYPGENGIDYAEKLEKVTVPDRLKIDLRPRLIFSNSRTADLFYNYANNGHGSGSFKTYGGHSYYDAVPAKKYAKTRPEYFIMTDSGSRTAAGNHLCISNPEVQNLLFAEMCKWLDRGASAVALAQTDGYIPCRCPECRKISDDPGERLWIVHRKLAERLLRERPGKKAHIISYGPTMRPPETFREFPENVIVELCHYQPEQLDAWKKIKVPGGFTVYLYNWGNHHVSGMTPVRTPKFCADQVRLFINHNVRGLYRCGFGEFFGLEGPTYYVFGKMWDDPGQSPITLTTEFINRAYRESAQPMQTFHRVLNDHLAVFSRLEGQNTETSGPSLLPSNPRTLIAAIYSPNVVAALENALAQAEARAVSSKVKARLKLVRTEFDYVKNLVRIFHIHNAYLTDPSPELFRKLARLIEERNRMIDSFFAANGRWKRLSEWPQIQLFGEIPRPTLQSNGRSGGFVGAPLNWDCVRLSKRGVLPGVGRKAMTVKSLDTTPPDGFDFDSGIWKKAQWHSLAELQLGGELRENTRFKMLYGKEALYVAVEADLAKDKKFSPRGPDGPVYLDDCIEFIIDPEGDRSKYYHFIYGAVKNSRYDAAFGLIDDPLHPKFNDYDSAWNGDWSYRTERRDDKWYSLFTLPYAAVNAVPPRPGERWFLNVGRESLIPGSKQRELSSWSPNFENNSFHNSEVFGEMRFE